MMTSRSRSDELLHDLPGEARTKGEERIAEPGGGYGDQVCL